MFKRSSISCKFQKRWNFIKKTDLLISYQRLDFIVILRKKQSDQTLMIGFDNLYSKKVTTSLHNNYNQHHLHPFTQALFSKHPQWLKPIPVVQSRNKTNTLMPNRKEIVNWQDFIIKQIAEFSIIIGSAQLGSFRILFEVTYFLFLSLSPEDFAASTTIDSSNFIESFLKNLGNAKHKLVHLPTSRFIRATFNPFSSENSAILKCLIYVPTSDPILCFDYSAISPKKLLNWLQDISFKQVFELSLRSVNKENPEQNLLWFNSNSFHPLADWLASEIEKSVLKFYFNRKNNHTAVKSLKQYFLQHHSSESVGKLFNLTLQNIEEGYLERFQDELSQLRILEEHMRKEEQAKLMNLNEDQSKKTKKRKKKIKRSLSELKLQKQSIGVGCESANNEEVYQSFQLPILSLKQQKSLSHEVNFEVGSPLKSISKSSEKTCDQLSEQQMEKLEGSTFKQEEENEFQQETQIPTEDYDLKKKRRRRKNGRNANKIMEQFKSKAVHRILNKQLDGLLDSLSMESNQKLESKVLAFERTRYIVRSMYPYSDAILFGSNAVGLSLPTSDIDIMLVGLPFSTREELCFYLSQVETYLSSQGWIASSSIIPQAKVPILKLQIDTRIHFLRQKGVNNYWQIPMQCGLDLMYPLKGSIIKVDLTISNDINGISPPTQLMRNEMSLNPSLQRVLLALKYILTVRGYSQSFKGGIGSYCLFIMVAAYFRSFQEKRQQSDCEILLDVLKFYGEEFDNHHSYVTLSAEPSLCFVNNVEFSELTEEVIFRTPVKIINPLNHSIISNNCYQYPLIKAQCRTIREQILKIGQLVEAEIINSYCNVTEISKLLASEKSFEKWLNRTQAKMNTTVGNIIAGKY